jgi:hypothetical protein
LGDPEGEKPSVTQIRADEVGASLKWATAKVERVTQCGNGDRGACRRAWRRQRPGADLLNAGGALDLQPEGFEGAGRSLDYRHCRLWLAPEQLCGPASTRPRVAHS